MNRYYLREGYDSHRGDGWLTIVEEETLEKAILKAIPYPKMKPIKKTDMRTTKKKFVLVHVEYDIAITTDEAQKESNE